MKYHMLVTFIIPFLTTAVFAFFTPPNAVLPAYSQRFAAQYHSAKRNQVAQIEKADGSVIFEIKEGLNVKDGLYLEDQIDGHFLPLFDRNASINNNG